MTGDRFRPLPRRRLLAAAASPLAALLPSTASAQGFPSKPVRIVVNNATGGATDLLARAISQPVQEGLGQSVVVDNRGGAGGLLGGEVVATSAPDGHTMLLTAGSMVAIGPHLYKKMPFDPVKDLVPVAPLGRATLFLLVRPAVPANNVQEFIRHLKANPGKLSYGSAGNGSSLHLAGEMFKSQAGVFAVHVPYRGAGPAIQDLLAGQIDFIFDSGTGLEQVRAGKLKLLAVANLQRSSQFPDVPTLNESGLKGFDAGSTYGLFAPAGTPADAVQRVNREVVRALGMKNVRDRIQSMGAEPTPGTPADLARITADDSRRFGAIVRERKIALDS
ncbi:tripartite tricarboxylate transporter substrate binding protein [Aquabacterium sp. J223]|uniref:Bug family tripartite tricarboxylate transporter substrate binding protein n=1 Tax=Aquabacterium sp. J223 TaxID=2898431 RepID=UPI0021ADD4D5|nr:tripartite tricarboxylate transporter substrate binding protein [Aquabacterium sp. J223]UUX94520.1 tripartite tricarboxylate transporter substrate binding protein [Aquabacterium sp. J223]